MARRQAVWTCDSAVRGCCRLLWLPSQRPLEVRSSSRPRLLRSARSQTFLHAARDVVQVSGDWLTHEPTLAR